MSGVLGAVVWVVASLLLPWQVAVLLGWDAVALAFVLWVLTEIWTKDSEGTARLATREDDSRAAADLVLTSASVASLVGVGFALVKASRSHGAAQPLITAIAVATVVLSWAAVHVIFILRYGRLYYSQGGGVDFNERGQSEEEPDYQDFAYLSFTIGMTYQVSDTDLTTKSMRRAAIRHALLSYVFGTFVVAMTINVVAGLLK